MATLTQKPQSISCAPFNAIDFLDFFCNKIEIRTKINSSSPASSSKLIIKHPPADSHLVSALNTFEYISLEILSTGLWDRLLLLAPAASCTVGSGSPDPGLRWIIALLCLTISLYLYFCKMLMPLYTDLSVYYWLSCVACPLPGHQGGQEVVWLRIPSVM